MTNEASWGRKGDLGAVTRGRFISKQLLIITLSRRPVKCGSNVFEIPRRGWPGAGLQMTTISTWICRHCHPTFATKGSLTS